MTTQGNTALRLYQPKAQKKRSRRQTLPGSRSHASAHRKKHNRILYRFYHFCKVWRRLIFLVAILILIVSAVIYRIAGRTKTDSQAAETVAENITAEASTFVDSTGTTIDVEAMTDAWAAEAGITKRYELTDEERWEIASVITAEADGEPLAGKEAIAQCILQTCEDDDIRPSEVLAKYGYSKRRPDPSDEALEAVQAVFDFGQTVTSEPIKYYYAPALTDSEWHESQTYVMTINNHKFFKEAEQ